MERARQSMSSASMRRRQPERVGAALVSTQGVASTLLEGMYHLVTQLYTHEAGGWPRGRFSLLGPRLGRRKPARLPQESKSFRTYFPTRLDSALG